MRAEEEALPLPEAALLSMPPSSPLLSNSLGEGLRVREEACWRAISSMLDILLVRGEGRGKGVKECATEERKRRWGAGRGGV